MNLRAGSMITWRGTRYEVILITALHAVLRDDTGSEIEASIEELSRGLLHE